jgi:hypothetical protein
MSSSAIERSSFLAHVIILVGGAAVGLSAPAHAAVTISVSSTAEGRDAAPGDGSCATSSGQCTLRAAIEETNALPGSDTVTLGGGTYTLTSRVLIEDDLVLSGAGSAATVIDGASRAPLLRVRTMEYLICDSTRNAVWSHDRNGQYNGAFVRPGTAGLNLPISAHLGPNSDARWPADLYVTGFSSGVHRFDGKSGVSEGVFAPSGSAGLLGPSDAVFGPSDSGLETSDDLFVTVYQPGGGILRFDGETGTPLGTFISAGSGGLGFPNSLAFRGGSLYVTSVSSNAVLKYDATTGAFQGTLVSPSSGGLTTPRDLLFAPDGSLLVTSWGSHSILRYNSTTGAFLGALVPSGRGGLNKPTDLELGFDGTLLVISQGTRQVLRYDLATGAFKGVLVSGGPSSPVGLPSCIVPREELGYGPIVSISDLSLARGTTVSTDAGAALYNGPGATTTLNRVVVRNNMSGIWGGAIHNQGLLDIRRSEIHDNELPGGGGGVTSQGGGIYNNGTLKLERVTVASNFATRGGGISNGGSGRVEVRNSTISGNRVIGGGGGIRNAGNGHVLIASSTITGNRANEPGGIGGEPDRFGGGIVNIAPARVSIGGTILAGNTDGRSKSDPGFSPDCHSPTVSTFTSERANLVGVVNDNCALRDVIFGTDASFDLTGTPSAPLDPLLAPLGANGGPTRTHALTSGSPAIDTKTAVTSSASFDCPVVDQRGHARPADGDGNGRAVCDLGAYEALAVP